MADTTAIEALRQKIAELEADLHTVQSAPYPSADVKRKFAAQIETLAEAGKPNVLGGVLLFHEIDWRRTNAIAVMAWLFKDALLAAIDREVDTVADDDNALSQTERARRAREIRAEISQIEMIVALRSAPAADFERIVEAAAADLVAYPVAVEIRKFLLWHCRQIGGDRWEGTPTALFDALARFVPDEIRRSRFSWPQKPNSLGTAIDRAAPVLRENGVRVHRGRTRDQRVIMLSLADPATPHGEPHHG